MREQSCHNQNEQNDDCNDQCDTDVADVSNFFISKMITPWIRRLVAFTKVTTVMDEDDADNHEGR